MKIRHQLVYEAPPAEVFAMRADPAFRERVCQALDTVSQEISVDETDAGLTVRVDMQQHTHGVPAFARKIVGETTRVVQTEHWATDTAADLEVEIPGKPGHIRGRLTLAAEGATSVYTFEGEATIKIPLVGGKLEGLIHELFLEGMDTEQRVGAAWLAGEHR